MLSPAFSLNLLLLLCLSAKLGTLCVTSYSGGAALSCIFYGVSSSCRRRFGHRQQLLPWQRYWVVAQCELSGYVQLGVVGRKFLRRPGNTASIRWSSAGHTAGYRPRRSKLTPVYLISMQRRKAYVDNTGMLGSLHRVLMTMLTSTSSSALAALTGVLFCSLAVLDGQTMDVLSPFVPVFCHSD